jgi:hypothetical protein
VSVETPTQGNTTLVEYFEQLETPAIDIDISTETVVIQELNESFCNEFGIKKQFIGRSVRDILSIDAVPLNTVPHPATLDRKKQDVRLITDCSLGSYLRNRILEQGRIIDTYFPVDSNLPYHRHINVLHRVYRHNLKNGISVIKGWAEVIASLSQQDSDVNTEQIYQAARTIIERSQELNRISNEAGELRNLLEIDSEFKPYTLEGIFKNITPDVRSRFEDPNLSMNISSGTKLCCNDKIHIAFDNLIDNAFRHNPIDTDVEVAAHDVSDDIVEVRISDTGDGIPQVEQNVLTNPHSISQINHSNGLGLWISRWIFDMHNVKDILVDTNNNVGTVIRVLLPSPPNMINKRESA